MPPRLSKPTSVPQNHESLIEMLWRFYVGADAPSLRAIKAAIDSQDDDQRKGTANHETIRRTLKAVYLPEWHTVELIFEALCQIADVDPDDDDDSGDYYDERDSLRTHRQQLHVLYRLARHGTLSSPPRTRSEKAQQEAAAEERRRAAATADDPWGRSPGMFRDEPPF